MIKSRKIIIENAVKKVFGEQVKLNFSSKKININNSAQSQLEDIENTNQKSTINRRDSQSSTNPLEKAQKEFNDNSSKNLANFFNGEIIDLDE